MILPESHVDVRNHVPGQSCADNLFHDRTPRPASNMATSNIFPLLVSSKVSTSGMGSFSPPREACNPIQAFFSCSPPFSKIAQLKAGFSFFPIISKVANSWCSCCLLFRKAGKTLLDNGETSFELLVSYDQGHERPNDVAEASA